MVFFLDTGPALHSSARRCSPVRLGSAFALLPVLHPCLLPIVNFDPRGHSCIFSETCTSVKLRPSWSRSHAETRTSIKGRPSKLLITNRKMPRFKLVHVSAREGLHACLLLNLCMLQKMCYTDPWGHTLQVVTEYGVTQGFPMESVSLTDVALVLARNSNTLISYFVLNYRLP